MVFSSNDYDERCIDDRMEARAEEQYEARQIEKHFEEEAKDDRTEKLPGHQDAGRD